MITSSGGISELSLEPTYTSTELHILTHFRNVGEAMHKNINQDLCGHSAPWTALEYKKKITLEKVLKILFVFDFLDMSYSMKCVITHIHIYFLLCLIDFFIVIYSKPR